VALTWAGGLADWILFLCLVSNIVEVLAHLAGTPFSNIVMGTQSILLDIGGFALLTMAVHAHQRGERRTRNSAAFVGGLLMLVTLATVVLITVGNLWPKAADQVQNINQALILARIGMTIVYECTIHLLRHAATAAVFARRDVIVVASVSCIFGLGSPQTYEMNMQILKRGEEVDRDRLLRKLVSIQYTRNDTAIGRGTFRVRGETLEIWPAYAETAYRIVLFGDEVEHLQHFDPVTGELIEDDLEHVAIWPASHSNPSLIHL